MLILLWIAIKSIPSFACFSIALNKSSSVMSTTEPCSLILSMDAWYTGTEPTGNGDMSRTLLLITSKSPPILNSIKQSAPWSIAICAFLTSSSKSTISVEVPTVAFTLVLRPAPIPEASMSLFTLLGITIVPLATDFKIKSSETFSIFATCFISSVNIPFFASLICVMISHQIRFKTVKFNLFKFHIILIFFYI